MVDRRIVIRFAMPTVGPTGPLIQWVSELLSSGVKRLGRETHHSPISSVEINNVCAVYSPIWLHGVRRDNFALLIVLAIISERWIRMFVEWMVGVLSSVGQGFLSSESLYLHWRWGPCTLLSGQGWRCPRPGCGTRHLQSTVADVKCLSQH
jgi:hypothetical protein